MSYDTEVQALYNLGFMPAFDKKGPVWFRGPRSFRLYLEHIEDEYGPPGLWRLSVSNWDNTVELAVGSTIAAVNERFSLSPDPPALPTFSFLDSITSQVLGIVVVAIGVHAFLPVDPKLIVSLGLLLIIFAFFWTMSRYDAVDEKLRRYFKRLRVLTGATNVSFPSPLDKASLRAYLEDVRAEVAASRIFYGPFGVGVHPTTTEVNMSPKGLIEHARKRLGKHGAPALLVLADGDTEFMELLRPLVSEIAFRDRGYDGPPPAYGP